MSKNIKLVITFAVITFLIFIGTAYWIVQSKLNRNEIRKLAIENIEKALPGATAQIKTVDYSFGTSVVISLEGFELTLKKNKNRLVELGRLDIKIPLWSIITSGGNVDIIAENPKIYYHKTASTDNWTLALPKESSQSKNETEAGDRPVKEVKIKLPSFLEKSKVNIKIYDIDLFYALSKESKGQVKVSKFLVKNIGLKGSSAFEVVSDVNLDIEKGKAFTTSFQLIGDVELKQVLSGEGFSTNIVLKTNDTKASWVNVTLPDSITMAKVDILKSNVINFDLSTKASDILNLEASGAFSPALNKLTLSKLDLSTQLDKVMDKVTELTGTDYQELSFNGSAFFLRGIADINLETLLVMPNLAFGVSKDVTVNAKNPMQVGLRGTFKSGKLDLSSRVNVMEGTISSDISVSLDMRKLTSGIDSITEVYGKILATNLKFSRGLIQSTMYSKQEVANGQGENTSSKQVTQTAATPFPKIPKARIDLEGKHIFVADRKANFIGKVTAEGDKVNLDSFVLSYSQGNLKLRSNAVLRDSKNIQGSFHTTLSNFELAGFNAFLPPIVSGVEGTFNGKVNGSYAMKNTLLYSSDIKVSAKNGRIRNLNLADFITPVLSNIKILKGKVDPEKMKITDEFDSLKADLLLSDKEVRLKSLQLIGNKASTTLNASGLVQLVQGKSKVVGDLRVKVIEGELKKSTGKPEIPFMAKGESVAILPDIGYTTDKLLSRFTRVETKKQKKKIQTQFKKEKDKIEKKAQETVKKELEEKAKKLLKGLKF